MQSWCAFCAGGAVNWRPWCHPLCAPKIAPRPVCCGPGCNRARRPLAPGRAEAERDWRVDLAAGDAAAHKIAFDAASTGRHPFGWRLLPAAQVLRKHVILPLAAAKSDPGAWLRAGAADTLYRRSGLLRPAGVARGIAATIVCMSCWALRPKTVIDEIWPISHLGVNAPGVVVSDELESTGSCLNLLRARLAPQTGPRRYWLYGAMAGVTLVLFGRAACGAASGKSARS